MGFVKHVLFLSKGLCPNCYLIDEMRISFFTNNIEYLKIKIVF